VVLCSHEREKAGKPSSNEGGTLRGSGVQRKGEKEETKVASGGEPRKKRKKKKRLLEAAE